MNRAILTKMIRREALYWTIGLFGGIMYLAATSILGS
jgi:hypothetical protein